MAGIAPAGPRRPFGGSPGSEVSLRKLLEHRLLQLGSSHKLFDPGVLFLELSLTSSLLGLHPAVVPPPPVLGRLCHPYDTADLDDGLTLDDQLLRGSSLRIICSAGF